MPGMLFITCPEADHKVVNRALWHLKDLTYGAGDRFHIVTTRDTDDINNADSTYDADETEAGSLRQASFNPSTNVWSGASLTDVEKFVLDLDQGGPRHERLSMRIHIIIDSEGVKDQTCIIGEHVFDEDVDNEIKIIEGTPREWLHNSKFNKLRCPWDGAYSIWCNLDIANMFFVEFADSDAGADEDGWWQYQKIKGSGLDQQNRAHRNTEIEKLEKKGNA